MSGYIYIQPIGNIKKLTVEWIKGYLSQNLGFPVRVLPNMNEPSDAIDPVRKQYHSTKILKEMIKNLPDDAFKIIGIADVDLYVPVLTFVFGEAQLGGKALLVSTARLCQEFYGLPANDGLMQERLIKEVLHELWHTFGLTHCPLSQCVMYLSNNVSDIDSKDSKFCNDCAKLLRIKLEESVKSMDKYDLNGYLLRKTG